MGGAAYGGCRASASEAARILHCLPSLLGRRKAALFFPARAGAPLRGIR